MTIDPALADGTFAIATVDLDGEEVPVLVAGEHAVDLRGVLPGVSRTADLFADWDANLDRLAASAAALEPGAPGVQAAAALRHLPPVQPPGALLAAGANYREHIIEISVAHRLGTPGADAERLRADAAARTDERGATGDPYVWVGLPSAMCGADDDVLLPDVGGDVDWELELGVVIGRTAHRVPVEQAMEHVAGYTIVNDLTARTLVPRTDIAMMGTDWFRSKNQPTFFPTGPYLVPARFVPDPAALRLQLRLNGELRQDAAADDLLFDIPALISYASSVAVLRPGDLLITGSPPGNGSHWGRFLREGDVLEASVTGLGTQRNRVRGPGGELPPWQAGRP